MQHNSEPNAALVDYAERHILPQYASFDSAHRIDHAMMVIEKSIWLAKMINESPDYVEPDGTKTIVNIDMVYAIAVYHDTGLTEGRETHHTASARIIKSDRHLPDWFTHEQIETMAIAVEDHRASAKTEPRNIYGRIVAEADRTIVPIKIIERTVQYGMDHYPELDFEGNYNRAVEHLNEKYAEGGYLRLWFDESPNLKNLDELRCIIKDRQLLKQIISEIWNRGKAK